MAKSGFAFPLLLLVCLGSLVFAQQGQSPQPQQPSQGQQPSQTQSPQTHPSQNPPSPDNAIPDAPSAVQPPSEPPEPQPVPKPETKKPVERDPWTNQPINQPPAAQSETAPADQTTPPPPMPPVKTLPPGTSAKQSAGQDQLYTFVVHANFVQVPVTVKDHNGRSVDGLLSTDFTVKENGVPQKLTYFTADPFAMSVAIILDLGMPDAAVQQVNETFPALVGAFAPYDEVSLYTYSSTVSQITDFTAASRKMIALLNQMKTERGYNNGPPILSGPLAPNGPIINGVPVGSPTEPVYTPTKDAHVLNDAILQAALDLSKRDRARRKIIFIISDGRESGSKASYRDVLRVLLSHEIEVKAVALEGAAVPIVRKLEQIHIPEQGRSDILPKYTHATGGGDVYTELTRSAIEDIYARAMGEARNQYTLGYVPSKPKVPTRAAYHEIEVIVHRPGLKVIAKDGYYPALAR